MASSSQIGARSTPSSSRISGQWSDLSDDVLVSIFSRLSSADLIAGVSSVCSSWRRAARNPHCWRILDLSDWCSVTARIPDPVTFNLVFNRVLGFVREYQLIEEVHFPRVATEHDLVLVADRLPNLFYFSFENPTVHNDTVCSALSKFKSLKGIAINQVFFLLTQVPSLLGTNFPSLSELKLLGGEFRLYKYLAFMIRQYLPKLRKLEMQGMEVSSAATLMLLNSLQHLEYLDISGYNEAGITEEVIEKASRLKVFIWHSNHDLWEVIECPNCEKGDLWATCECVFSERVMQWLTSTQTHGLN